MSEDVEFESVPAEDAIDVVVGRWKYRMAVTKFVCPDCGGTMLHGGFINETATEGVRALGIGLECRDCGHDSLHVAYPGERVGP